MMLMTSMLGCAACSSDGASKEATDVSANDNVPTDFQIQYTKPVAQVSAVSPMPSTNG